LQKSLPCANAQATLYGAAQTHIVDDQSRKGEHITKGFVQLGLDVEAIISSAYPGFGFGGRNSAELLLVNFGF